MFDLCGRGAAKSYEKQWEEWEKWEEWEAGESFVD
jgi:hypothetical protein